MFLDKNKKNNVYPCKPKFYYIKVGLYRECLNKPTGEQTTQESCLINYYFGFHGPVQLMASQDLVQTVLIKSSAE